MLAVKNLLLEMAVYSEEEVYGMNPVASVSTEATNNLEGEELRHYVYQNIQSAAKELNCSISENDIGVLIRHHCGFRKLKKAALLTLPFIVNANLVTAPWRRKVDKKGKLIKGRDRRPSGMISAPIVIDGVKYLCNITNKTNLQGRNALYALTLKDENGNIVEGEKMADPSNVPHSNSEPSTSGNAHIGNVTTSHEPNPSFQGANLQQNIETNNNNDIKTENIRMNKKQIRLTENDLKQIVKESVNKILSEAYGTPDQYTKRNLHNLDHTLRNYSSEFEFGRDLKGDPNDLGYIYNEQPFIAFNRAYVALENLKNCMYEIDDGEWSVGKNVFSKIITNSEQLMKFIDYAIKKLKIASGEQPDNYYNYKHLKKRKI